jgi:Inositol monophosphatase family
MGKTRLAQELAGEAAARGVRVVWGWLFEGDPVGDRLRALPGRIEPVDLDTIVRVAEGDLEAVVDGTQSQVWDRAPHVVLVEEAGGRYRDRTGGKDLELPGALLTNGRIDAELDEFLTA